MAVGHVYLIDRRLSRDYLTLRMRVPPKQGRALPVLLLQRRPILRGVEAQVRIPLSIAADLAKRIGAPRVWSVDTGMSAAVLLTYSTNIDAFSDAIYENIMGHYREFCDGPTR